MTFVAGFGPPFVTRTVYVIESPASTLVALPDAVTERSAGVGSPPTAVVAVASLSLESGSRVEFVTLADALTLGGGTAPPGRATTMTNGSLRPSGKDCRSHVMGPLVPKSGAVVGVGMAKRKTVPAGASAVSSASVASDGPAFDTTIE